MKAYVTDFDVRNKIKSILFFISKKKLINYGYVINLNLRKKFEQ